MSNDGVALLRPQPLGVFPLPAGFLLVPGDGPDEVAVCESLVAGRLPISWPASLRGQERVYDGRAAEALADFGGVDPVSAYNRFVLEPEGVDVTSLRASLPAEIAPLVDVVAYTVGLSDVPPELGAADGEIAALVLATQASAAIEQGDLAEASGLLDAAAQHATGILAASLRLQLATLLHGQDAPDSPLLKAAIDQYYNVLQVVDRDSAPELWAAANLNLGTAYLTMPMVEASDSLRSGIAMQALRASMEVFTKETHPAEWASANLNLANALVYTPSTKQGDNIVEAVERYEEVLSVRDRDSDPLGYARLLANLGNALAHLGIFDHAKARLYEARYLFEEQGDHDSVMAVRSVLDEVARETVPTQ